VVNFPVIADAAGAEQWADVLRTIWEKGGGFSVGMILGAALGALTALAIFKVVSKERKARDKLWLEREKQLQEQLMLKEKRIDELHAKLQK
jgi:gas vesicle protein